MGIIAHEKLLVHGFSNFIIILGLEHNAGGGVDDLETVHCNDADAECRNRDEGWPPNIRSFILSGARY